MLKLHFSCFDIESAATHFHKAHGWSMSVCLDLILLVGNEKKRKLRGDFEGERYCQVLEQGEDKEGRREINPHKNILYLQKKDFLV